MFSVIEFESGEGISVVRSSWLTPREREVFWPPVKDTKKFNKILQNGEKINTETWKIYPVERCFYETGKFFEVLRSM